MRRFERVLMGGHTGEIISLGVLGKVLGKMAKERENWASLIRLLPPQPGRVARNEWSCSSQYVLKLAI